MNNSMRCRYCGSPRLTLEDRGVHKAIICERCGKYQKFATKEEIFFLSKTEKLESAKPTTVANENKEEVKMSFAMAFSLINNPNTELVKRGMRLPHWKEDVLIRIQFPDENSKMTAPYFYVESRFGRVPWIPTQIELFSEEWVVVYEC